MGGKIPTVEVSATSQKGIPDLLELILLVAEMEDLSVENTSAQGVVVESYLDKFRGATATLLVTSGTLKTGDIVGTPSAFCKIRSLEDFSKRAIEKALPSTPVVIFGFNQAPTVGEKFKVFPDLDSAREQLQSSTAPTPEVVKIEEEKADFKFNFKNGCNRVGGSH